MFNDFTILKSYTMYEPTGIAVIAIILCIISFVVGFVHSLESEWKVVLISTLLCLGGAAVAFKTCEEVHYYKIIFDKSISADFFEKYDIMDQEGKIFTIKEKTNN